MALSSLLLRYDERVEIKSKINYSSWSREEERGRPERDHRAGLGGPLRMRGAAHHGPAKHGR